MIGEIEVVMSLMARFSTMHCLVSSECYILLQPVGHRSLNLSSLAPLVLKLSQKTSFCYNFRTKKGATTKLSNTPSMQITFYSNQD